MADDRCESYQSASTYGMPVRVLVTEGTRADRKEAVHLIEGISAEALLADRGYDTDDIPLAEDLIRPIDFKVPTILADRASGKWAFREFIANRDADLCIPPGKDHAEAWHVERWLYKERHIEETFFLKLKEFQRHPYSSCMIPVI